MQRPVVFKSGGKDIYGVLHLPYRFQVARPVPVVIFCHGFTGTKVETHRIFVKMARALEKYNIASLRFDFRGCGDSGGDFVDITVGDHIKDATRAVNFAVSQPGINKTRIGVLGFSLGGTVASYVAGRRLCVKALALWAPAADLLEEANQIQSKTELKKIRKYKAVDYYGTLLGKRFVDEIPKIHPVVEIENYRGSTIIIHGTKDKSVPLSHSLKYYRTLKRNGRPVERCLIEGADHTFTTYLWEQTVIKKTLKFFMKNL